MKIFEEIIEASAKVADQVAKVAGEYIDKGKDKITKLSLENDMSKAQRQLGALVYVMHKTGENNPELLEQYISDVARIELQLATFKEEEDEQEESCCDNQAKACPICGTELGCCDMFCRACGAKIEEKGQPQPAEEQPKTEE